MGKSLNMNYVNCALLVVVLVLVVVCCVKSKTKEGFFSKIQISENGKRYPNAATCFGKKKCAKVRADQYNWLRKTAAACDKKRKCVQTHELNKMTGEEGSRMGAWMVNDEYVYGNFCSCPKHGQDKSRWGWGLPDVT
jgi:hypothetical protein